MRLVYGMLFAVLAIGSFGLTGCSQPAETVTTETVSHEDHDHDGEEHAAHDHSGWWCNEHGVPEDECALCDTSLVANFKAKNDWCDEHSRPDSQCFKCNPDLQDKFAARYEAKFGEQPPAITE